MTGPNSESARFDSGRDVELYTSPWVSGTRATQYFGPISVELFLAETSTEDLSEAWEKAEVELLEMIRDKARALGANAVVGLEMTLDPFAEAAESDRTGLRLHAVGTAAKLEPLF